MSIEYLVMRMNSRICDVKQRASAAACLSLVAVFGAPGACFADEMLGAYAGAKLGWGRANMEMVQFSGDRPPRAVSFTDNGFSAGFFCGYAVTPTWGIEGALGYLGKYATGNDSSTLAESVELPFVSAALTGQLPLNDRISLVGKFGAAYIRSARILEGMDASTVMNANNEAVISSYTWGKSTKTVNSLVPMFGLALDWRLAPAARMQLGFERYPGVDYYPDNKLDVNVISLGVYYQFGQ